MSTVTSTNQSIANRTAVALASGFKSYDPIAPVIFKDKMPTRETEIFVISAQDSTFDEVAQDAAYPSDSINEAGTKSFKQASYKKKLNISQLMKRFDSEGAIMEEAYNKGYLAKVKMDQLCANVLNNGFTTETTWDGQALFYDSHTVGTTPGATNDNLTTGALTDTTLNAAIVLLRTMKDMNNAPMPLQPAYLVVPPALWKKARELVESTGNPEAANLNVNTYHSAGIKVVCWNLLTSTTAWFLLSEKNFHYLYNLTAIPLTIQTLDGKYTDNGSDEIRVDWAMKAGAPNYVGAVGSTGL